MTKDVVHDMCTCTGNRRAKDDPRRVQYDRTELMWDTDRLDPRHGVQ